MTPRSNSGNGLWGTFSFLTKVRYGGVLGKVAAIGIVFFLTLCVIAIAGRGSLMLLGAALLIAICGLIFLVGKIEAIFKSNPGMATLEGTEVIKYRQAELKSKNHEAISVIELTTDPKLPKRQPTVPISNLPQHEEDQ